MIILNQFFLVNIQCSLTHKQINQSNDSIKMMCIIFNTFWAKWMVYTLQLHLRNSIAFKYKFVLKKKKKKKN